MTEHSRDELVDRISRTIGSAKAREVIETALEATGLSTPMSTEDALTLMAHIAENEPGIVGLTARFAKSRLHLAAE